MKKKKGFTTKKHIKAGNNLKHIINVLGPLTSDIVNSYPQKERRKVARHIAKAMGEIDAAKCILENMMVVDAAIDLKEWPVRFAKVYYGADVGYLTGDKAKLLVSSKPLNADREDAPEYVPK